MTTCDNTTEGLSRPRHFTDQPPPRTYQTVLEADDIPLSALVCEVPRPRAVLLALHGGGTTSAYFDCPGHPSLSLLRIGASLGFTVLALDRPG